MDFFQPSIPVIELGPVEEAEVDDNIESGDVTFLCDDVCPTKAHMWLFQAVLNFDIHLLIIGEFTGTVSIEGTVSSAQPSTVVSAQHCPT